MTQTQSQNSDQHQCGNSGSDGQVWTGLGLAWLGFNTKTKLILLFVLLLLFRHITAESRTVSYSLYTLDHYVPISYLVSPWTTRYPLPTLDH